MEKQTGKNSITSKQYNRGLCLKLITTGVCNTRIELSKRTKLSKMTVTNIVSEFISNNIVEDCEEEPTEMCGRNPVILRISDEAPKVIGLLIYRDRIEAVLTDLKLNILHREKISFQTLTKEKMKEYCYEVIDKIAARESNILGLGAASIGPVDIQRGIMLNPPRFYGIKNVDILGFLRERYSWPIYFDHDNNGAALAEKLFGSGKNKQEFFYLGIANGIGSGIISGGEVYHNQNGLAPEFGHISIDCNGLKCDCGNHGCVELYASVYIILEKLRKATGKQLTFSEFCKMEDDQKVDKIFRQMIEDVGCALVSVVNLLQPQLIVLGYDCVDWADKYVRMLEDLISDRRIVRNHCRIAVCKAYFGKDAQLAGAAVNVVDQLFKGNLSFTTERSYK